MLHEIRSYTLIPGKVHEYLKLAAEVSLPIRKNDAGVLLSWFYSAIGEPNKLVHIWEWKDLEERQRQRVVLRARLGWVDVYNPQVDRLVYRREVEIIKPEHRVQAPAAGAKSTSRAPTANIQASSGPGYSYSKTSCQSERSTRRTSTFGRARLVK